MDRRNRIILAIAAFFTTRDCPVCGSDQPCVYDRRIKGRQPRWGRIIVLVIMVTSAAIALCATAHASPVPDYSSRPGARNNIFIDFRGAPSPDIWGGLMSIPPLPAPSFTTAQMTFIAQSVAADYAGEDVNITTVNPATGIGSDWSHSPGVHNDARVVVFDGDFSWEPHIYSGNIGVSVEGGVQILYAIPQITEDLRTCFVSSRFIIGEVVTCIAHESACEFGVSESPIDPNSIMYSLAMFDGAKFDAANIVEMNSLQDQGGLHPINVPEPNAWAIWIMAGIWGMGATGRYWK